MRVCMYILWLFLHWTPSFSLLLRLFLFIRIFVFYVTSSVQLSVCVYMWMCVWRTVFCSMPFFFRRVISHKSKLTRWKAGSRLPHRYTHKHTHTYPISPHAFYSNFHIRDFLPQKLLCVYDSRINKLLSVFVTTLRIEIEIELTLCWHCMELSCVYVCMCFWFRRFLWQVIGRKAFSHSLAHSLTLFFYFSSVCVCNVCISIWSLHLCINVCVYAWMNRLKIKMLNFYCYKIAIRMKKLTGQFNSNNNNNTKGIKFIFDYCVLYLCVCI